MAWNNGQLKPWPWVAAAFEVGSLKGVPQTVRLPSAELAKFINCNDAYQSFCGEDVQTLKEYKRIFVSNMLALKRMDRTVVVDKYYLDYFAEEDLIQSVRENVYKLLPSATQTITFAKVLLIVEDYHANRNERDHVWRYGRTHLFRFA